MEARTDVVKRHVPVERQDRDGVWRQVWAVGVPDSRRNHALVWSLMTANGWHSTRSWSGWERAFAWARWRMSAGGPWRNQYMG